MKTKKKIKKIALAYSGGLDTSIIIPWLKEQYEGVEIIGICTNVGQDEDWENMEAKALKSGASKLYIKDIKEELAAEYILPMVRAGAIYEGKYLLGTSIARPLQSKHQVEMALAEGCDALCHGCTGKGNDQVRFELTYKALAPELEVIAPWRIWDIQSREDAIDFATERGIELTVTKEKIYSRDWNIWHMSHEGGDLEELWNRPKEDMFLLTKSPKDAPDVETEVIIDFEKGMAVGLNGEKMSAFSILKELNRLGYENGIGRKDIVETRLVGMKSRGVYETPGGTILHEAIRDLEMVTLDRDSLDLKNKLAIDYSNLVYAGKWYTTARESLEAFMAKTCEYVTGSIRLVLYKGNITVTGRKSKYSLYLEDLASFGESDYDHNDAQGFINLFGLSTGVTAMVHRADNEETGPAALMKTMAATYHKE